MLLDGCLKNSLLCNAYTLYGSFGSEVRVTLNVTLDLQTSQVLFSEKCKVSKNKVATYMVPTDAKI